MEGSCGTVAYFICTSFELNLLSVQLDLAGIAKFTWFLRRFYLSPLKFRLWDILCLFVGVQNLLYFPIFGPPIFFGEVIRLIILLPLFTLYLQVSNQVFLLLSHGTFHKLSNSTFLFYHLRLSIIVDFFLGYLRLFLAELMLRQIIDVCVVISQFVVVQVETIIPVMVFVLKEGLIPVIESIYNGLLVGKLFDIFGDDVKLLLDLIKLLFVTLLGRSLRTCINIFEHARVEQTILLLFEGSELVLKLHLTLHTAINKNYQTNKREPLQLAHSSRPPKYSILATNNKQSVIFLLILLHTNFVNAYILTFNIPYHIIQNPQKMSNSKHKRTNSKQLPLEQDKIQDSNLILQHVRRIDGQELVRKYNKCGLLGKGGFANCFITENMETKRRSATKIVLKDDLKTHRTRLRLANQIRLHKTLHHPNVVEFQHCFEDKDNVYIFLQLCSNQSLNELIHVRTNFITPQIQSFMYGIVSGVKYIHSQRIIHRDLKLGNIFIDGKFNVKIGDFGLATKLQFKKQCKRTVCGTPNYIAPQVLEGKGYHFEVDIWSIGVILYTFYYGIPPFETEDANATYQKIRQCNYVIPKTMTVPNEAVTLITRLLLKNPAGRPTLDQILNSSFMQLGQGILKELPSVCSRKAPSKKQLTCTGTLKPQIVAKPQAKAIQSSKDYVVQFEQVLQDTFYYKLANDQCGMLEKDVQVLFKRGDGKYCIKSLTNNNYQEEAGDSDLKYLLMGRERRFNLLDQTYQATTDKHIFVRKVQRIGRNRTLLRLSNRIVQFLMDDSNYVYMNNGKLFEIVSNKEKQINLNKLMATPNSIRGNPEHLQLIRRVVQEIENKKDGSKENRP